MVRTRVGYAGGTTENPTYRNMGDHSETVQIDYDPERISFEQLLGVFWDDHDPERRSWSRQYMNAVFYHSEEQKISAGESRERISRMLDRKVETEILPFTGFTMAEDYHQKHTLQRFSGLMDELQGIYPSMKELTASTAAGRINGYVAGYGSCDQLKEEIGLLGLSRKGRERLAEIVCGSRTAITCNSG